MRFMVLVYPGDPQGYQNGAMPEMDLIDKMMKYNEELVRAGVMRDGGGFQPPAKSAHIAFPAGGQVTVTEGPIGGNSSILGGYWLWEVPSKAEALAWAQRAPMEPNAVLELRQLFSPEDFGPEVAEREYELLEKLEAK